MKIISFLTQQQGRDQYQYQGWIRWGDSPALISENANLNPHNIYLSMVDPEGHPNTHLGYPGTIDPSWVSKFHPFETEGRLWIFSIGFLTSLFQSRLFLLSKWLKQLLKQALIF